jgi:hypothetical protein
MGNRGKYYSGVDHHIAGMHDFCLADLQGTEPYFRIVLDPKNAFRKVQMLRERMFFDALMR